MTMVLDLTIDREEDLVTIAIHLVDLKRIGLVIETHRAIEEACSQELQMHETWLEVLIGLRSPK
jgi:hypothetical protein